MKALMMILSFLMMFATLALLFACEYYNMPVLGAITVILHLFTFGHFVHITTID